MQKILAEAEAAYKYEELANDYKRLVNLLCVKDENAGNHIQSKRYEEIILHAGLLNMQLYLESERSGREDFLALSREFENVLEILCDINLFKGKLAALLERGNKEAKAAGIYGSGQLLADPAKPASAPSDCSTPAATRRKS